MRTIGMAAATACALAALVALGPGASAGNGATLDPSAGANSAPDPNIAISPATLPYVGLKVAGRPRVAARHPNVAWDWEDIEHYKTMLRTSRLLQTQLDDLKRKVDEIVARPISIPEPQRGADGRWLFPGLYFPAFPGRADVTDPRSKFHMYFSRDADSVSDLGTAYALTGDERYAKYARDLLIAYSNASRYGAPKELEYRFAQGLSAQLLDDALILQRFARGYDLIYNSSALSSGDRTRIHDELLQPLAWQLLYPEFPERDLGFTFCGQLNNRGAIGAASVLLAGYASDDQELIDAALYGVRSNAIRVPLDHRRQFPPPKDWTVASADNPSLGLLTLFLTPKAIPDGIWVEGSPGYALYALASLVNAAEAAWRHGVDLYSYNDGILKHMFDFPILFAYPDLTLPGENDSPRRPLAEGPTANLYQYGYRRYLDRRYLAVLKSADDRERQEAARSPQRPFKSTRSLSVNPIGDVPPPFLYDLDPRNEPEKIAPTDVNYPSVGFGLLRIAAANGIGIENLILSYGPSASHGHPDKLHIDLYAFDDVLMPSPGINYPYAGNSLLPNWYKTTVAHNTLVVDEKVQEFHEHDAKRPDVRADQTVYAPGETTALQRAWTDSAYPGVRMDRAVFFTDSYLADLFAATSDAPHTYDLAWHIRGGVSASLPMTPTTFPNPVPVGYNMLTNVRQSEPTAESWTLSTIVNSHLSRLVAAGGVPTRAIVGDGGIYVDGSTGAPHGRPEAPTILERREGVASTVFGNALDLSGRPDGYVKTVTQSGGIDQGFAALKIQTADGEDVCFAAYRPGDHRAEGLDTDALQAFASLGKTGPRTLYLAGGKFLKAHDAWIRRSEAGLAYVEPRPDGSYVLGNASPTSATVTVRLNALQGLQALTLGADGKPKGKAAVDSKGGGEFSAKMDAASRIGFFPPGKIKS